MTFVIVSVVIGATAGFVIGHLLGDPFMSMFFGKEWYLSIKRHPSRLMLVTAFVLACSAAGGALGYWLS